MRDEARADFIWFIFLDASNEHTALLKIKLSDPEEHVRDTTCKIFGSLDYETTLHHVTKATLKDLSSRMMDKKVRFPSFFSSVLFSLPRADETIYFPFRPQNPVRGSAIHSVAKLYSLAFPEM